MAIGDYLKKVREEKGMSLRDVETALRDMGETAKISSGHLSLIEQGTVKKPSPHTLHALAKALGLSYMELMVEAGYLERSVLGKAARAPAPAFRGAEKLSPTEKRQVEEYIEFITMRQKGRTKSKE